MCRNPSATRPTTTWRTGAKFAIALFVSALAAGWTQFEILLLEGCVPTTAGSATVPLLNAWTIEWNLANRVPFQAEYWNAPIFYPVHGAFAFSEPQPITTALLPDRWLGASSATL